MNTTIAILGSIGLCLTASALAAPHRQARVRIIAIQMKVSIGMYRDTATFKEAMERVVSEGAGRRASTCPTLIALPKDIGLGLVFLGQWDTVKDAKDIREAGALLGTKLGPSVMANVMQHNLSPTRALLMTVNELYLRDTYYRTFSEIAAKHHVYLAAGSAPLSRPGSPDVTNRAVLFGPDGKTWANGTRST